MSDEWLNAVRWNSDGLVAAIVQDCHNQRVLMMAWMNRESLALTLQEGRTVFWSRSRRQLWRKGEQSGHTQRLLDISLDCDGDALLLHVEQIGGAACHTGRESCFYRRLEQSEWQTIDPVVSQAHTALGGGHE